MPRPPHLPTKHSVALLPMATVKAFSICRLSSFGDAHKSQIVLIYKGFWPLGNLSSCRQFSVYSWQTLQLCGPLKAKWRTTHTRTHTNISINNGTWYISGRAHKALYAGERERKRQKMENIYKMGNGRETGRAIEEKESRQSRRQGERGRAVGHGELAVADEINK